MRRSVKAKLKPPPPPPQEQERTYTTREVMSICDVTPRQLQWWDEEGLVRPEIKRRPRGDRARHYALGQVTAVSIVAELRRKGISLGAIRRILSRIPTDIPEYLLIADGKVHGESDQLAVIKKAKTANGGVMLLEIGLKDGIRIAYRAAARSDSRSPVSGLHRANGVTGSRGNRGTAMGGGAR
jgi:DNA-binding transcriptional MerR regulator